MVKRTIQGARTVLAALVFALAMVFGASQALAAAGPAGPGGGTCPDEQKCDYYCITQMGANYGFCMGSTCMCRSGP